MQRVEKLLNWIFPFVFIVAGFSALFSGMGNLVKGFESYSWERETATIVESRVIQTNRGQSKKASRKYAPIITYSYLINEEEYLSDKVLFGFISSFRLFSSSKVNAKKWTEKYPVGANVNIYVNPDKKSESVILNGAKISSLFLPLLGVILLIIGVFSFRGVKKEKAT